MSHVCDPGVRFLCTDSTRTAGDSEREKRQEKEGEREMKQIASASTVRFWFRCSKSLLLSFSPRLLFPAARLACRYRAATSVPDPPSRTATSRRRRQTCREGCSAPLLLSVRRRRRSSSRRSDCLTECSDLLPFKSHSTRGSAPSPSLSALIPLPTLSLSISLSCPVPLSLPHSWTHFRPDPSLLTFASRRRYCCCYRG